MSYYQKMVSETSKRELKTKGYIAKYQENDAQIIINILKKEKLGQRAVQKVK